MSDEITAAITDAVSDLPGSDADVAASGVDTTTTAPAADTTATTTEPSGDNPPATDGEPAAQPQMSRSQRRIHQLLEQQKAMETSHAAALKEMQDRLESLKWAAEDPHAKVRYDGMMLAEQDPKRFAEILAGLPEYEQIIALKQAQQAAEAAAAASPASTSSPAAPSALKRPEMPAPDIDMGNGVGVHSAEVIQQYAEDLATYAAAAAVQQAVAPLLAEIKSLKDEVTPVVRERQDKASYDKKLSEGQEKFETIKKTYGAERVEKLKGAMNTWLHQQWANNKRAGLDEAVQAVLVPALLAEIEDARKGQLSAADKARAQVIADTNTRAAAAERPAQSSIAGSEVAESSDPIGDAIRGAIAGLPR